MKVFLIIRFSEALLSIKVLATLCHPIDILTTKGMLLSNNSVYGWSSSLNEMPKSDHFILFPGTTVALALGARAHALQRSRGSQRWHRADAVLHILSECRCPHEV
jgi:hypothetical protein